MNIEQFQTTNEFKITNWTPNIAHDIEQYLEKPNWAPWLAASVDTIKGRSEIFPEGQLLILDCQRQTGSKFVNKQNLLGWTRAYTAKLG